MTGVHITATLALGLAQCFHTEALAFEVSRAPSVSGRFQLFVSVGQCA